MRKQQTQGASACFQVESISRQCFGTAFTSRYEPKVLSRRRSGAEMGWDGMGVVAVAAAFIFTMNSGRNSIPKKQSKQI